MRLASLLCILSLGACAAPIPTAAQTNSHDIGALTAEFLFDPFDRPINRSIADGNSLEKIRARFGAPQDATSRVGGSRVDPGAKDEYLVWYYDWLTFHINGPTYQKDRWIEKIVLDGGDYRLKFGLRLRGPRRDFLAVLEPARLNSDERSIRFDSAYTDTGLFEGQLTSVSTNTILVVDFDTNGIATKMTWNFYAD